MKWAEMTPEQRNVLVTEKIMQHNDQQGERTIAWTGHAMLLDIVKQLIETETTTIIPAYSTDMAAAWLIVEKLRQRGTSCMVQENFERYLKQLCESDGRMYPWILGVNAERVCIAALQAFWVRVEL